MAQFRHGDFSTCDAPRPGRPKTVTTTEIIDQIHELILEDRWISAKSIDERLGISCERVGSIAASYLLCIMYFSVISLGHSLMIYGTSIENNSYLIETVSTLTPINSNSPTRISLLSAVNASLLAAMNSRGNFTAKNKIRNGPDTNTQVYIYKKIVPQYIKNLRDLMKFYTFIYYIN